MNWCIKILIGLEIKHYIVPCRINLFFTLNLYLCSWEIIGKHLSLKRPWFAVERYSMFSNEAEKKVTVLFHEVGPVGP